MNFIVFDFETTGRSARFDQILQAGFIVYNNNFEEIDRLNIKSRLNPDIIPSIHALRVNRLTMSQVLSEDLTTYQMTLAIEKFLSKYENCFFIGFNSINFDEEFLRQLLWEHFFFPYISNTKGNKRGDLFNFVTMAHALDKDCVNVPRNEDGKLSFKLERLAEANNFDSSNSHEAIADVEVTMKLFDLLVKKNQSLFEVFKQNSVSRNVEQTLNEYDLFTYHSYMFASHRIYLVKKLIKHPVYNNQYVGFDLKYDTHKLIDLDYEELRDVYKNKSFFRKIKLNKQPNILDKSYALKVTPYSEFSSEEIDLKCKNLEDENFIKNLTQILQEESSDFQDNQSQEEKFEEETIYTHNINYQDSMLMNDFHLYDWEEKWTLAEKFRDTRLKYFAAKHIYRNFPEAMPKKIFNHLHKKISERVLSLNKQKYITLPAAMEEADNLSFEIEENGGDPFTKEQLEEYNIYINFLNDYYSQQNPKPIKFDSDLSKKLFA